MEDRARLTWAAAALAAAALAACGPRRGGPLENPYFASEPAQDRGRVVFMQNCYKCHPGGEAGLGPALTGKPRPARWLRFRVRHAPGAMPSFDEKRLADKELDDLMAYLTALRGGSDAEHEPFEAREASR
jgi:mono/diheme cytochrome c family protein